MVPPVACRWPGSPRPCPASAPPGVARHRGDAASATPQPSAPIAAWRGSARARREPAVQPAPVTAELPAVDHRPRCDGVARGPASGNRPPTTGPARPRSGRRSRARDHRQAIPGRVPPPGPGGAAGGPAAVGRAGEAARADLPVARRASPVRGAARAPAVRGRRCRSARGGAARGDRRARFPRLVVARRAPPRHGLRVGGGLHRSGVRPTDFPLAGVARRGLPPIRGPPPVGPDDTAETTRPDLAPRERADRRRLRSGSAAGRGACRSACRGSRPPAGATRTPTPTPATPAPSGPRRSRCAGLHRAPIAGRRSATAGTDRDGGPAVVAPVQRSRASDSAAAAVATGRRPTGAARRAARRSRWWPVGPCAPGRLAAGVHPGPRPAG